MDTIVELNINLNEPEPIIHLLFVKKREEIGNVLAQPIGRPMYEDFAGLLTLVFEGFLSQGEWAEWVETNIKLFNIRAQRKAYGMPRSFECEGRCGVPLGLPCNPSVCGAVISEAYLKK